jgi:hypothetical protein
MTPPCGESDSEYDNSPSSITPACSHFPINRSRVTPPLPAEFGGAGDRVADFLRDLLQSIERSVQIIPVGVVVGVDEFVQHLLEARLERHAELLRLLVRKVELLHDDRMMPQHTRAKAVTNVFIVDDERSRSGS